MKKAPPNKHHSILFLSANDFKDKSIQVIRKTPEAFVKNGWQVRYIVSRDTTLKGSYYYEKEINPKGISIDRFNIPLAKIINFIDNHTIRTILSKISGVIIVLTLYLKALSYLRTNDVDIIYGYETHGVLAANLLKITPLKKSYKYVNRFMGTWLTHYINKKRYIKLLFNFDHIIALRSKSDLCIMTNDGTQGDKAMKIFKSKSIENFYFWCNGVDKQNLTKNEISTFKKELNLNTEEVFLSISRLEGWKKVDRAIHLISKIKNKNIIYYIVGDGPNKDKLKALSDRLNLQNQIVFVGSIPNNEVKKYLSIAKYFFTLYDLSNVGNPLLEAIRANKIIITLNNGDTSKWITHQKNGLIFNLDSDFYTKASNEINKLMDDAASQKNILASIHNTEKLMLWTWEERMEAEVNSVASLITHKIMVTPPLNNKENR